jgi:hypothetical protein
MVSGFEKRMLSGMFRLLSVDCAKAGKAAPATASVTAPARMHLRETWLENCCGFPMEDVSGMLPLLYQRRLSHIRISVLALAPTDLTVDSRNAPGLFTLALPLHMAGLGVVLP